MKNEITCTYCGTDFMDAKSGNEFDTCSDTCHEAYTAADPRIIAFAQFEGCGVEDAETWQNAHNEQIFESGREYMVVTDGEATDLVSDRQFIVSIGAMFLLVFALGMSFGYYLGALKAIEIYNANVLDTRGASTSLALPDVEK